jgi:two-component system cell cycle response regulator DivK
VSKIVVIEDNTQSARMVDKLLKNAGHEVLLAQNGEAGLTAVFGNNPDLILVDLGLPDIDGQTVVALIRQQPSLSRTPIIAFTAWPEDTAYNMARAYSCDGVIIKPLDTRRFAGQIAAYLEQAQIED